METEPEMERMRPDELREVNWSKPCALEILICVMIANDESCRVIVSTMGNAANER